MSQTNGWGFEYTIQTVRRVFVFLLSAIIQIDSAHISSDRGLMWAILKLTTLPTPIAEISEGRGFDSRWCHRMFSLTYSFRSHYGPGVDSASNRNENQGYFLEVKAAGAQGWKPYHLNVPTVLKSWSLKLTEPSGPVKACNGIALFFTAEMINSWSCASTRSYNFQRYA
jgi:hypothetical protein